MIWQLEPAPELARLLEKHKENIATSWARKVHGLSNSYYQQVPPSELEASARRGLSAFIDSLNRGSLQPLESFLREVTMRRLDTGFDISEVIEALLLLGDAASPVVWRASTAPLPEVREIARDLEEALRVVVSRLSHLYAEEIKRQLQEQQKQARLLLATSDSLQRVTSAVLQRITTLDEALAVVCAEARNLIGAGGSTVLLLDQEGWLRVTKSSGVPRPVKESLAVDESFAGFVIEEGRPLLLGDTKRPVQPCYPDLELKSLLCLPLRANDTVIGALDIVNKPGGFTEQDIRIMSLFADQAAIAIENAQLHQRAGELAVVEERHRLARELHDSVTQALYSVNLYADATRLALAAEKTEVAAENLNELRNMVREALLDMRMLIFELHPPALEQEGLVGALQSRLEAVEARSGLRTEFYARVESRPPFHIEEELYRIAQEALSNAVKHARAQRVIVRLTGDGRSFCLEVEDDGSGFDPATADQSAGLGLRGIKERAQQVNGHLTIDSKPGEGTILRVEVET